MENAKTPHKTFFFYQGAILAGAQSGRWKLMFRQGFRSPIPGKNGQPGRRVTKRIPLSQFDVESDVSETTNVVEKHPDVVRESQAMAAEVRKELGDRIRKKEKASDRSDASPRTNKSTTTSASRALPS